MTKQAFTEMLILTRCACWNTDNCPHMDDPDMQLSIINSPRHWLLSDQSVKKLNQLCDGCGEFYLECLY